MLQLMLMVAALLVAAYVVYVFLTHSSHDDHGSHGHGEAHDRYEPRRQQDDSHPVGSTSSSASVSH